MSDLTQHFTVKRKADFDSHERRKWFIKAREDRERREQASEKLEDDLSVVGTEVVAATQDQIRAFESKLTAYETATVETLIINQERLDAVNARVELMLSQAFVMEDGRRVFKTEDGTQVFDEFGNEVGQDELDFDLIDPSRPSWESFKAGQDEKLALEAERQELLEFQDRLDTARSRLAESDISKDDLDELDAELEDLMPASIRERVPGFEAKPETTARVEEGAPQVKAPLQSGPQSIGMP